MSGALSRDTLSPVPILEAAERYRGKIIDLDADRVVGPDEFARAREGLVARLRAEGLAPGDRVVLALPNGPAFLAALAALLAAEASPLLVHVKTPPAELLRYARRFGSRFLASASPGEPGLEAILRGSTRLPVGDFAELGWGAFDAPDARPGGPELRGVPLHPTSGSTGLPKIALRPGFAAMEEARHYAATMAIDEDDCVFTIPPMSHAYGYGTCVMTPLLTSADIVCTARFSIKQLYRALREFPITVLPNVPANIDLLLFGGGGDFARLRWMLAAGSVLPERSARLFRQKTGVAVCPLYGTTETGGISVATAADGRDVDGRVGPPMNGVEVQIRRAADDEQLGDDVGRLWVRSSSMMAGYLDDRGQITLPTDDGWFETGDLARLEDGVIHLRGRGTDVINVLGLKVVPQEVEEAIAACPGVREVKVYAGTRGARSEIVKAAVAVERGVTEADIRAHCERHLVYYKRPQTIALVEALPRSPAGKIVASQLP